MTGPDPLEYGWWLASRASGVVALLCVAVSVGVGLAMAGRVSRRPGLAAVLMAVHRQTALAGLVAIAVHGLTLLGDGFLDPGLGGIAVPFVLDHARVWTGLGVLGGWLAALLGLSFWIRDRIGPGLWRALHRATVLVYVLAVAHTLGSGSDAGRGWLQLLVVATAAPILFLFVVRILPAPRPASRPAPVPGVRRLRIADVVAETSTIRSLWLEPADDRPLPDALPGQSITVHAAGAVRAYSLSGPAGATRWRISVKRESAGTVSRHLHDRMRIGDVLEVGEPAGRFILREGDRPVVLVSAGVGATPLLAMLWGLASADSPREVWWVHAARAPDEHAFRTEALDLVARLRRGHHHVHFSAERGRLTPEDVMALGAPLSQADVYVCGPPDFADALRLGLPTPAGRFHSESFGSRPVSRRAPAVAFARSGITVRWDDRFASLLDLAEAHDVAAPSSCRVGACHGCRATLTSGRVDHAGHATDPPPQGALLCCARPAGDVVLDL